MATIKAFNPVTGKSFDVSASEFESTYKPLGWTTTQQTVAPTVQTPNKDLYIGATNWANLQKQYTPYQLEQSTQRVGQDIYWNPNVSISSIPSSAQTIAPKPTALPTVPTTLSSNDVTGATPTIKTAVAEPTSVPSLMAGLDTSNKGIQSQLEVMTAPLPEQAKVTELQKKQADYTEEQKTSQRDLQESTWEKYGLNTNVEQVQQIMPQIARVTAEFNSLQEQNANQPISSRIIGGTQDRLLRQKAIEVAGLSAVAQAYQGNVDMARGIASDAINAQYQDQANYYNSLNDQISNAYTDLNTAEKKKADQLTLVNNERLRLIEEEKEVKTNINNLAIEIAQNGADPATVSNVLKSATYGDAIKNSGKFIKTSSTSTWDTFTDGTTGETKLINKQTGEVKNVSQTTTNLGNQIGEIYGLPSYDTRSENPGVSRSDRNNNPGNIKVSDYTKNFAGVIGVESSPAEDGGNFLIFDSADSGINAIGRLLLEGKSYQGVSAEQAIKKYNGNGAYGASTVGLDPKGDFQSQIQDPSKLREVATAIAQAEGFTGGQKKEVSKTDQMAIDIFNGTGSLTKVSTKDYPAVQSKLAELKADALSSGDLYGVMKASAGGKDVDATTVTSFEKAFNVIGQLGQLNESITGEVTDPIWGIIRSNNPYDAKAKLIEAQLTSIVPNLARGIYGEVGVLTDNDVKLYASTLPNLKSTEEVRNLILASTVRSVQRSIENKIKTQAALGRDLSGLTDVYSEVKTLADGLENSSNVSAVDDGNPNDVYIKSILGEDNNKETSSGFWNWLGGVFGSKKEPVIKSLTKK